VRNWKSLDDSGSRDEDGEQTDWEVHCCGIARGERRLDSFRWTEEGGSVTVDRVSLVLGGLVKCCRGRVKC
jgi:hypothetical protein